MKRKFKVEFDNKIKEVEIKTRGETVPPTKVIPDKKSKQKSKRNKKVTYEEDL